VFEGDTHAVPRPESTHE
jgi:hypothetical protein